MRKVIFYIGIGLILFGFSPSRETHAPVCYSPQEVLEYRLHYGFMNAGDATIEVHPKLYYVNNKVCYKATVSGKSTGAFDLMLRIRDTWGSYFDTTTQIPQRAYRDIEEGGYKMKELAFFDYNTNMVNVERENREGKKTNKSYTITPDVQDIVSGFYFLRNINFSKMTAGNTFKLNAFFEDKTYDFKIKYIGKEVIDTKFGEINAIVLSPIMPENQLFDGENPIKVYLSDDKNKIPLKIEAEMLVGSVEMDLKGYKGLKFPITFED